MQDTGNLYVLLCIVYIPGGFSGLAPGSVPPSPTPKQKQNDLLEVLGINIGGVKLIMKLDINQNLFIN